VSLRNRVARLERMSGDAGVEEIHALFRRMQEHSHDPEVSAAVDNIRELMKEAEAALGHRIMPRQWLDDRWMVSWGLIEAINCLMCAVHACAVRGAESTGAENETAQPPAPPGTTGS
jgi:hypothetical protein